MRHPDSAVTRRSSALLIILLLALSACSPAWGTQVVSSPTAGLIPPTVTPLPQVTSLSPGVWLDPSLPETLRRAALASALPPRSQPGQATTRLVLGSAPDEDGQSLSIQWVYALVAPFPTLLDGVAAQDAQSLWQGTPPPGLEGWGLWMDDSTLAVFTSLWGQPGGTVFTVPAGELLAALWSSPQPALALLPFESLEPRWKVLAVDGQSPLHRDFDPLIYPLTVSFTCLGVDCPALDLPHTNRDPSKLTVMVMTGVTALVRGTAWKMEQEGIEYPGRDIRQWLLEADITHISNEIPFAEDCPYPDPYQEAIVFCSHPSYLGLLQSVGADVIELTGNHFQDWGTQATLFTLELYRQAGLPYYGGGADLADSRQAVTFEHNGNRIALIGCNAPGPEFAWATETRPGAAPCGDLAWLLAEVERLKADGYLPVVTFQHYEYYTPEPRLLQTADFHLVAQAGAVIVSGSQAHAPQGMEFFGDSFLMYGLGNLFFDQMYYPLGTITSTHTRQELIARHVFYENRHISTELLTAMLEDYAKPRPMTAAERDSLLENLFSFSIWDK